MSRRRIAAALAGVLGAATLSATALSSPALANVTVSETSSVPSGGVFAIEGHGWGHGHGLSQYGAQGGAKLGRTADQITGFYYPGTARAVQGNPSIRVQLRADNDNATEVYPASGLVVADAATGAKTALPTGPTRWRSLTDTSGLHVQQLVSGAWKPFVLGGRTAHTGPIQFSGPTFIRLALPGGSSRDYRGALRSVRASASSVISVNVLPMESYLLGVVPRESSSSWAAAALQAQSIAARSYSQYKLAHAPSAQAYDICDTTQCQVYGGSAVYDASGGRTSLEPSSTTAAVQQTAGVIRTYQGTAIFAEFSASNGGWSTDGGTPYLIPQSDPWDGVVASTVHSWRATVSAAQIQSRYPAVGRLLRMRVTERDGNGDWRGRVKKVVLEGVDGAGNATSVSTTGAGIYNAHTWPANSDGMRSSWWHVIPSYTSEVVSQSVAPRLVKSPGISTGQLTVSLKNTGTASWSTSVLHLSVASPPGQADPLVGNSTKPGVYAGTASSIPPGSTADFTFALTGNGVTPGLQARSYRLRLGTDPTKNPVFGATVSWIIPVDAPLFQATLTGGPTATSATPSTDPDAPGPVLADGRTAVVPIGGKTPLTVTVRNTGNITWPVSDAGPLRLGTTLPYNRESISTGASWLVSSQRPSAIAASAPVAPGQSGTLGLTLYGNGKPVGAATEVFQPVWEGIHWIAGANLSLAVVRVNPAVSRLATVDLAPAAKVTLVNAPNGSTVLTLRMRNVGGGAWAVGAERLVASATPLATSAWSSNTQPPSLARNVTRPSVGAVYPGEVGEWRIPLSAARKAAGSYGISFRLATPGGAVYGPSLSTTVSVVAGTFTGYMVRTAGTVNVPRNGTVLTAFDIKNTGNTTWPVGGVVRSESLVTGGSPSHATSWLTSSRPGPISRNVTRSGAIDVRPGEVARFAFLLAGNGRVPQATSEPFGVVWETWARIAGLRITLPYHVV